MEGREEDEDFNLVLYALQNAFPEHIPTVKDLPTFVEKNGVALEGMLQFPYGWTVDFFQVIKDLTGKDLLVMAGGTCYENPEELSLAAGAITIEEAEQAMEQLKKLLVTRDQMKKFEEMIAKKQLEVPWAVRTLKELFRMLLMATEMKPKPAAVFGIYE